MRIRSFVLSLLLAAAPALAQEYSRVAGAGPIRIVRLEAQPEILRGALPLRILGPFETAAGTRLVEMYAAVPSGIPERDEGFGRERSALVIARVVGLAESTWWSAKLPESGRGYTHGSVERIGIATAHIAVTSAYGGDGAGGRYEDTQELFWSFSGCEPRAYILTMTEPVALGTCGVLEERYKPRERMNCAWDGALDTVVCWGDTEIQAPGRSVVWLTTDRYRADTGEPLVAAPPAPSLEGAALAKPEEAKPVTTGEIVVHAASLPSRHPNTAFEVLYDLQTAGFLVLTVRDGHHVSTWKEPGLESRGYVPFGPVHASIRFLRSRRLWNRDGLSIHQIGLVDGEVHEVVWVGVEERGGEPRIDLLRAASSRGTSRGCGSLEFPETALAISNEVRSPRVFAKRFRMQGSFLVTREEPDEASAAGAVGHVTWNDGFQVAMEPDTEERPARIVRVDESSGALSGRLWSEGELSNW